MSHTNQAKSGVFRWLYAFLGVAAMLSAGITLAEDASKVVVITLGVSGLAFLAKAFGRGKRAKPPAARPPTQPDDELAMAEPIDGPEQPPAPKAIAGTFGGKKGDGGKFTQAATTGTGQMALSSAKYLSAGQRGFRSGTTKHTGTENGGYSSVDCS